MKYIRTIILTLILIFAIGVAAPAHAFEVDVEPAPSVPELKKESTGDKINDQLDAFTGDDGADLGEPRDPRIIAALVINILLGMVGMLMLSYIIYGGYLIMTSAGNEDRVKKGRSVITNAIIGLAIILASYGIVKTVTWVLQGGNNQEGGSCYISPNYQEYGAEQTDPFYGGGDNEWFTPDYLADCEYDAIN